MIHYSAYNGSPVLSAFAAAALRDPYAPVPFANATLQVTYASAVSTIVSTTSSIISADTAGRGMIGGGLLHGENIAVLGEDTHSQMLGVLAVWAAGGAGTIVTVQEGHDFEWVDTVRPTVLLYPTSDGKLSGLVEAHDWTPLSTAPNPIHVPFGTQPSLRADAEANPDRGYTTVSDEELAQTMRDLGTIDLDQPALFVPYSGVSSSSRPRRRSDQQGDVSEIANRWVPEVSVDNEAEGPAQEGMAESGDVDGVQALGPAACWAGPLPEPEGATYTHRDITAFVLGIDPTPEHENPVFTDGLDQVPAMVALAKLLKAAGAPTPLVV